MQIIFNNLTLSVIDQTKLRWYNKSKFKKLLVLTLESFSVSEVCRRSFRIPFDTVIEFSIVLCGGRRIKSLNNQYRNKNKITDVLSFQMVENLKSLKNEPIVLLGDIFICRERSIQDAKLYDISVEDELIHLFVHGFLHLLGLDHEKSSSEERKMANIEQEILSLVSKKLLKK